MNQNGINPNAKNISGRKFLHPGTFMSASMTFALSDAIKKSSIKQKALVKLIAETPLSHIPQPLDVVDIGYGGNGKGHVECTKDGEIAVSAAILYWCTGKMEYGELTLKILHAWAIKNKVWKGDNALLEASWSICSMARAAELMKYSGMKDSWDKIESAFFKWIDIIIMPVLRSEHIWKWKDVNNWHFSQICARMQLAILRENSSEWSWCVSIFPIALNKALIFKKCKGETTETCRDVTHSQMQLGGIIQAAEMAYHQGVEMYDNRMIDCFELQARIMLREIPCNASGTLTKDDIKTPYGYWYEPVWHIAYAHFHGRKGFPMLKTKQYIDVIGPDRICFHWGGNCLTHHL